MAYFDGETGKAFRKQLKAQAGYILGPDQLWPQSPQRIEQQLQRLAASHPIFKQILTPFEGLLTSSRLFPMAQVLQALEVDFAQLAQSSCSQLYLDLAAACSPLPQVATDLLAPMVQHFLKQGQRARKSLSVYDASLATAGFLQLPWQAEQQADKVTAYGHVPVPEALSLTLMYLILLGAKPQELHLYQGEALAAEDGLSQPLRFDFISLHLPQTQAWSADKSYLKHPAFAAWGILPPASKADWAHLLLAYHHLKQGGRLWAILPEAALCRKAEEGVLRQALAAQGAFDAVVRLPQHLLGAAFPMVLVVLKKGGPRQSVFYLDLASLDDSLSSTALGQHLAEAYLQRRSVQGKSALVPLKTMVQAAGDLSMASFVSSLPAAASPLPPVQHRLAELQASLETEQQLLADLLADLKHGNY